MGAIFQWKTLRIGEVGWLNSSSKNCIPQHENGRNFAMKAERVEPLVVPRPKEAVDGLSQSKDENSYEKKK